MQDRVSRTCPHPGIQVPKDLEFRGFSQKSMNSSLSAGLTGVNVHTVPDSSAALCQPNRENPTWAGRGS